MSWSINASGHHVEAYEEIEKNEQLPRSIKDYIQDGVEALHKRYGDEVVVVVVGSGHLHNGEEGNWDSTTATITVSKQS